MIRRLRPLLQPHRDFHQHLGALGWRGGCIVRGGERGVKFGLEPASAHAAISARRVRRGKQRRDPVGDLGDGCGDARR